MKTIAEEFRDFCDDNPELKEIIFEDPQMTEDGTFGNLADAVDKYLQELDQARGDNLENLSMGVPAFAALHPSVRLRVIKMIFCDFIQYLSTCPGED